MQSQMYLIGHCGPPMHRHDEPVVTVLSQESARPERHATQVPPLWPQCEKLFTKQPFE
jgi:hypothetical protein